MNPGLQASKASTLPVNSTPGPREEKLRLTSKQRSRDQKSRELNGDNGAFRKGCPGEEREEADSQLPQVTQEEDVLLQIKNHKGQSVLRERTEKRVVLASGRNMVAFHSLIIHKAPANRPKPQ